MTRIMGDSSTFGDVPSSVAIVAAYINGQYGVVTSEQFEAAYPSSRYGHVLIDVNGTRPDADVRDWEAGDEAGSLEQWVIDHNKHSGKKNAVIYCDRSTVPEVRHLTGSQVLGTDYFLWVATLDGTVYRSTGVIACQDKGPALTHGHWDSSIVFDDSFWQATGQLPTSHSDSLKDEARLQDLPASRSCYRRRHVGRRDRYERQRGFPVITQQVPVWRSFRAEDRRHAPRRNLGNGFRSHARANRHQYPECT